MEIKVIDLEHNDGQKTALTADAESWVDVRTSDLVTLADRSSLNETRVGVRNALNFSILVLDGVRQRMDKDQKNDNGIVGEISEQATFIESRVKEIAASMTGDDFLASLRGNVFREDMVEDIMGNGGNKDGVEVNLSESIILLRVLKSVSDGVVDKKGMAERINTIDKKFTAFSNSSALTGELDFGSNTE